MASYVATATLTGAMVANKARVPPTRDYSLPDDTPMKTLIYIGSITACVKSAKCRWFVEQPPRDGGKAVPIGELGCRRAPPRLHQLEGSRHVDKQARNRPKSLALLACLHFTNTQSVSSFILMHFAGSLNPAILALWHSVPTLQHEISCYLGRNLRPWQIHCLTLEYSTSPIRRRRHTARSQGLRSRGHKDSSDWSR
jgi:hypothetical protein